MWLSSLSSCLPCYLFGWGKNWSSRRQLEFGAATLLTESVKGGCQIQELPLAAAETRLSCGRSQRLMGLSMCASERAANCYHSPWNRFGPSQLAPSQTMSEHSLGTSMGLGLFLISCVDEAILGFGFFFGAGEKGGKSLAPCMWAVPRMLSCIRSAKGYLNCLFTHINVTIAFVAEVLLYYIVVTKIWETISRRITIALQRQHVWQFQVHNLPWN